MGDPHSHTGLEDSVAQRHETSDAHFKSVLMTGIGLLGLMVLGLLLSWGVYAFFKQHTAEPGMHAETLTHPDLSRLPPGPNLEADPHKSLVELRREEDSILTGYGWVSKDSGIVRIPVDRAMSLIVQKGMLESSGGK